MYKKSNSFSRGPRSHSSYRGGGSGRGGFSRGRSFGAGRPIDYRKFINKAVITESVEHFVPEHAFADFVIDERLKSNILKKGYQNPTPIQDKIIPHVLRGSDVVGIANTGTGKTAAFLIPLIDKILKNPKEKFLVVVPTRELAIQVENEFRNFTTGLRLFSTVCVGGAPIFRQIQNLRHLNHVVVGTPGRLKDLMERKVLVLSAFNTIVLDEADRMLDMGFINDMKIIMAQMPKKRHTLFFSATLSPEIKSIIGSFLNEPVTISVKTSDTAGTVDQDVVKVQGRNKITVLGELLKQPDFSKVLIFGRTKHGVEKLSQVLIQNGFKAESIHGDKPHGRRQKALGMFKDGHAKILVATDVAARGLDIKDITHVINFDVPATYEDYVHRVGRAGRAGKKGVALTFIE